MGPPGAGKGTQAKLLQEHLRVAHVSSGDLLRAAVRRQNTLGIEAKLYMERGELVPDRVLIQAIEERLLDPDCAVGFILDGFPRTIPQAEVLEALLARLHARLDNVTSVCVPRDELVKRMSGRRLCRKCGALSHLTLDAPIKPGICDECGGELYQREDDREATILARLTIYERETAPLRTFYRDRGILHEVDGVGSQSEVLARILGGVGTQT
jgi:adenylate kinase